MLKPSEIIKYYTNDEVRHRIVEFATNREVVGRYLNGSYSRRPGVLMYDTDILEMVKKGVSSFHASLERWTQPLLLATVDKKELSQIKLGWDLIIDIDCPILDYSREAAFLLKEALEFHDIKHYGVKFSGNTGFHFIIPFESFPEMIGDAETRLLFPDAARVILAYLREMMKDHLREYLLDIDSVDSIAKNLHKDVKDILANGVLDPFKVVEFDPVAISPRHLVRMPYVFNEKSGLISIPIDPSRIKTFSLEEARPENVDPSKSFMPKVEKNEAKELFLQAFSLDRKEQEPSGSVINIDKEIPLESFPPCIRNILNGLEDGRKRGLFLLINFLHAVKWPESKIKQTVLEWNKKNKEPLSNAYITSQLNYYKTHSYMPPNCDNPIYKNINVCTPDDTCKIIKNPLSYAVKRRRK